MKHTTSRTPIRLIVGLLVLVTLSGFAMSYTVNNQVQEVDQDTTLQEPTSLKRSETRLLAFGDSGDGSITQKILAGLMEAEDFDAVIHTGDVAYNKGTAEEIIQHFDKIYSDKVKSVFWPSMGNHDYGTDDGAPYLDYFKLPEVALNPQDHERYYSVDINDVHLVSLDTNDSLISVSPTRIDDMADWLRQDLANAEDKTVIVFFHHAPFNIGGHEPDIKVQQELVPIFDEFKVDLVLSGHDHNYQRTCPMRFTESGETCQTTGTTYVITGGGGNEKLYEIENNNSPNVIVSESIHHYVRIVVTEDSVIRVEAININGEVFDSFTI